MIVTYLPVPPIVIHVRTLFVGRLPTQPYAEAGVTAEMVWLLIDEWLLGDADASAMVKLDITMPTAMISTTGMDSRQMRR